MKGQQQGLKLTGSGGSGASRPGAAEMTEQVSVGSLSDDCKETVCEVDPRLRTQRTTGKKIIDKTTNMDSTKQSKKDTGTGEVGSPRPGAEGVQRHRYRATAKWSRWGIRPAPLLMQLRPERN